MKSPLVPHITEKAYAGVKETGNESSTYVFRVAFEMNKSSVKTMVESAFKVSVVDVRITRLPGKVRRFKGIEGKTSNRKKAVVRLKAGDRIAAFDVETKA